ncbi:hypothetical protein CKO42_18510 [Lamprobacter modestohalophilus]|uniref:Uncharacterized protein n=1 Tax=Lamprobacter modestohalophilus TaxID=1064514 RepID=A0A9X0WBL7_9GAMM|nr:hypothetical protein [Lamprobacter modestohalophilus]MBK1620396.1 hypothetical protein [Lamprobacter modestohalophilus]
MSKANAPQPPVERVEALFTELVQHYGDGDLRELRAAAKILLVALAKFQEHGGPHWAALLDEYIDILKRDPQRFQRMLESNRATTPDELLA